MGNTSCNNVTIRSNPQGRTHIATINSRIVESDHPLACAGGAVESTNDKILVAARIAEPSGNGDVPVGKRVHGGGHVRPIWSRSGNNLRRRPRVLTVAGEFREIKVLRPARGADRPCDGYSIVRSQGHRVHAVIVAQTTVENSFPQHALSRTAAVHLQKDEIRPRRNISDRAREKHKTVRINRGRYRSGAHTQVCGPFDRLLPFSLTIGSKFHDKELGCR